MNTIKAIKNQLKRAFTIVELVIVIAVIAILAAVLIPTFANLINSAEESNDMQTVANLNKIVAAYDTVGDIDTVNDALDGVLENGYSVSALTPTSDGNVIVYDSNSNRFALLTENALKTSTPEEDDIIYTDSTTTKTDWSTSTTWVFVKLSDVTANSSNVYDLTNQSNTAITGNNSYILTGTDDWAGKNVTAAYGVSLYDYTNTVTLGKVEITNTETSQQTVSANTSSNNKSAVAKTTTAADTTVTTIVVNVKAASLSCDVKSYAVNNHSEISISTTVKNCTFNEYGSAKIYDTTAGTGKVVSCNKNLNYDEITIYYPENESVEDYFTGSTTVTVDYAAITTVAASSVEITIDPTTTTTDTITVSIKITIDGNEIEATGSVESSGSVTLELGTEKYPFTIASNDDLTEIVSSSSGYYKLTEDYITASALSMSSGKEIYIDLNGYTLTSTYKNSNSITNSSELTISNGTLAFNSYTDASAGVFVTESSSKTTLNNVVATTTGTMLYPRGDTAEVNVIDSTITAGAYAVGTNAATVDNYNVTINVDNSTLIARTPVLVNVPGTYNFTDSVIANKNGLPCFIARGGDVTIKNCWIGNCLQKYQSKSSTLWNCSMDDGTTSTGAAKTSWGSGNDVPYSALCVGNDADSTAYQYPTTCTVTNTEFHTGVGYMCVYVEGNSTKDYGVTFTYSDCSFYYHTADAYVLEDLDGGTAFGTTTPTEYNASLYNSEKTNPLDYAIIYTSDTASYVTINGTVYQDGNK